MSGNEAKPAVSASERAISMLVGYTVGAFVVLPFDRLKSLMQVSEESRRQGAVRLARHVLATQGVRGLFKGLSAHMLVAPYSIFYYSVYDELLVRGRAVSTTRSHPHGHPLVPLGAAVCGRTLETSIRMPVEVLRTMMQTSGAAVTMSGAVRTLASQPPSTWFRGMVPTLLRDVPFSAIYWCGYEYGKSRVQIPELLVPNGSVRTLLQSFICGAGAGIVAGVLTTPVDVIKTVRQHEVHAGAQSTYANILRIIREKPAVAFAGIGPRLVRIPCGLATMMAGLEVTKRWFESRVTRQD